MTRLDTSSLFPGQQLSRAVYSAPGAKIMPRGAVLTRESIAALRAFTGDLFFGFPTAARAPAIAAQPGPSPVPPAAEAPAPVPEAGNSRDWLIRLKHAEEIAGDRAVRWAEMPLRIPRETDPWLDRSDAARSRGALDPSASPDALARLRAEHVAQARHALVRLATGRDRTVAAAQTIVAAQMDVMLACPGRFAGIALGAARDPDYLPDQAVSTAALSIAIAAHLGWPEADVRRAGLAGLLCDLGMLRVPEAVRAGDAPLGEFEINRVRRHTALTVAMLSACADADELVLHACYQHHEREDGSGYPTGARGARIGDLARVVAVADSFSAAVAPRPYRLFVKRPYEAMTEMIRLASSGKLDRSTVRALVGAAGLFPVGSWVRLSTNDKGLVLAANPAQPSRPIVFVPARPEWSPVAELGPGMTVDLAECEPWEASIVQPLDAPAPAPRAAA